MVHFVNLIRNRGFLFLLMVTGLLVQHSIAAGFSYHWGHPTPQGNIVYGMVFPDANHGWAVTGCGSFMKTSDGGRTWMLAADPDSVCNDLTTSC
jgi:hypothetical protein